MLLSKEISKSVAFKSILFYKIFSVWIEVLISRTKKEKEKGRNCMERAQRGINEPTLSLMGRRTGKAHLETMIRLGLMSAKWDLINGLTQLSGPYIAWA